MKNLIVSCIVVIDKSVACPFFVVDCLLPDCGEILQSIDVDILGEYLMRETVGLENYQMAVGTYFFSKLNGF